MYLLSDYHSEDTGKTEKQDYNAVLFFIPVVGDFVDSFRHIRKSFSSTYLFVTVEYSEFTPTYIYEMLHHIIQHELKPNL